MDAISAVINDLMRELTSKKKHRLEDSPQEWLKKSLTKKELGHIKFNYFRRGVLGLCVDSSAQLYRLNLQKHALLNKLKKFSPDVKDLHLNIGEV